MTETRMMRTLPGTAYRSAAWFERETELIFHREWFLVERPREDTIEAIQRFLLDVRQRYDTSVGPGGSEPAAPKPKKGRGRKKPGS